MAYTHQIRILEQKLEQLSKNPIEKDSTYKVLQIQAEIMATQQGLIANQERLAKQQAEQKAQRLEEMLKAMGVDVDQI